MKICFVGVGSIALRHIKNISYIFKEKEEQIQIDIVRSGKGNPLSKEIEALVQNKYTSISELKDGYNAIFITNPTEMHLETLKEVYHKADAFFIEKPIFDIVNDKIEEECMKLNKLIYIACPLRYSPVIEYFKYDLEQRIFSIRCICSSYLPDWRKETNYQNSYAAKAELGEGVSIDLIHEWDYIQYLFGKPNSIHCYIKKVSDLNIKCDDIALYIGEYPDKTIELHLDYFGRKSIRQIQVFTDQDTIVGDLYENTITHLNKNIIQKFDFTINDMYMKEMMNFFDIIDGFKKNNNDLKQAISTLKLTKGEI